MKLSDKIKKKQTILYLFILGVFSLLTLVIAMMLFEETPATNKRNNRESSDLPTDFINPQEMLNKRMEGELDLMQSRFACLESFILDAKEKEERIQKENEILREELLQLQHSLEEREQRALLAQKIEKTSYELSPSFPSLPFQPEDTVDLRRELVTKVAQPRKKKLKHVDQTIPPGTTVKALLVSSVDAPCGAYASSDPQPVKLQILDDGHLPKNVRARLKGGIVVASAYGDLSSERLYIRVERMTQVKPSGDFIETAVTGFITGEDGKYGVRGTVVDKSAKLVSNAAMSGVLSGINSYFQAYASSRWNGCGYGYLPQDCSNKDLACGLAAQGGSSGMENAFNTLTDYYIRRAEFIKPVLQVNAGRIVDLTFSLSSDIGEIHAQDKAKELKKGARRT